MSLDLDDPDAVGRRVHEQLRALGMTDEEILNGTAVHVSPDDVDAWLEGRAPCPVPGID